MAAIWTDRRRLALWLEVELQVAEAMAALGRIPAEVAPRLRQACEAAGRAPDRPRADRRDRARDPPRRDRVPQPRRGGDRPRCALSASRADLVRSARHHFRAAASRGLGSAAGRHRSRARGAQAPGAGAPLDALHRPLARHPRRAHHLRREARGLLCRVRAQPAAAGAGARRDRDLRDLGRGRHLRQCRPAGRGDGRRAPRPRARADLDPGDPARPACGVLRHARRDRVRHRAHRDRDPPSAAHRGRRGRRAVRRRPERQLGDAAQAQPGAEREPDRPCAPGARCRDPGARERRAVARARHRALLGRAGDRPGQHHRARFRAASAGRRDRRAGGRCRAHARQPREQPGADPFAAGAAGADRGRARSPGGLCASCSATPCAPGRTRCHSWISCAPTPR